MGDLEGFGIEPAGRRRFWQALLLRRRSRLAGHGQVPGLETGMLYEAPRPHSCSVPYKSAPGSVWRCAGCGTYWQMHPETPVAAEKWKPMGRLAVRRFARRQRQAAA